MQRYLLCNNHIRDLPTHPTGIMMISCSISEQLDPQGTLVAAEPCQAMMGSPPVNMVAFQQWIILLRSLHPRKSHKS